MDRLRDYNVGSRNLSFDFFCISVWPLIFQQNCVWEILAPPQWRITVNFTHFDIEGNNQGRCAVGYIYIKR